MQDSMQNSSSVTVKEQSKAEVTQSSSGSTSSPPNSRLAEEKNIIAASINHNSFFPELTESDDEEVSEVESFILDQVDFDDEPVLDTSKFLLSTEALADCSPCTDLRNVDPVTQAKLAALLEAAGLGKLSAAADGKQYTDPEVLRKLTSSVSCALDEAAAALTRMRAENSGQVVHSTQGRSLAEACSEGDISAVRMLLDEGHSSVHETTEEGESLLSFACSSGYFELAHILLSKKANVDDRGIKGDYTPLMGASSAGHVDIVKLLISHGADVNAQSQSGNTPLMCACANGHQEVVSVLLQSGANVEDHNENGHTPLMEAASAGHVPVAKILLEQGAGINTHSNEFKESALTLACYKGHLEMVRFLLEAGADQEHKTDEMHTALMEASMDGHVEVAKLLLDSGAQVNMPPDSFESPLTLAACGGHVELAMLLLERGANIEEVNDEGYTPLMEASREGHEEMVALLLSQGADINAQTEETQETALTLACCGGFLEVADFLIKAGADMELGASTPLMEASQEGHLELVRYLLDGGTNVNAQTATGDTALTYACENGHTDVADLLLQAGAFLEHESEGGRTPLMKASRAGHMCTIQFLISRGADVNKRTSNNDHTPLSLACAGGHLSVVELLLSSGSNPSHKLKDNSTMLIEAAKGGHTNVVQMLLDFPNNMLASPPPPPPPTAAEAMAQISNNSSLDRNINEPPRVPPHGLQVIQPVDSISNASIGAVNTSSTSSIASGIDGVTAATRAAAYLPGIQPGMLDNLQLQGNVPNVSSTLQPPLVRQNVPLSPHSLLLNNNNANLSNKPSNSPATSNVLKQDATLMTPQLVQLIKNCQQQAAMVNVASELSYDFEKSLVEGVSNAAAVAAAGMGLDLGMVGMDDKDLRPSERLEACINNMMKKAEMMHHNREEQILQKQQILEELQRVERELQEKAQAQILLNAQYRLENIQQNLSNPNAANNLLNSTSILDEAVNSLVSPSEIAFKGQANLNLKSHLNHLNEDDFVNSSNEKLLASDSEQHVIKPPPTSMKSDAGNNQGNILPSKSTVTKQRKASKNNEAKTSESMLNESDNCRLESSEIFGVLDEDDASSSMLITSAPPITPSDSNTISIAKTPSSTSLNGSSACTSLPAVPSSEAKFVNTSTTALISSTSASNVSKCSVAQSSMKVSLAKSSVAVKVNDSQDSSDICSTSVTANAATSNLNIPALVNKLPSLLRNKNIMKLKHNKSQGINVPRLQSPLVVDLPPLDDDIVPANSLPEIPQYHPAMFPGDQQVQTAMALAAQAYIPQTTAVSSCTVATQCMVDPCLMGPAPIPPGIPDTTTIPVPFLPSNQSPSSPQMSPSLYPTLGKFDVDSQTDSNHDTALTLACAGGYEELVTLLIQRSASIEHRDKKGFTPLILAATAGHAGVVEILLNHGAEIEAQSERTKDTPLSLACSGGRYEVVEILLARGANKEHRNVSDYTPLSLAASGGYVNIIKLLLNHGAEINSRTGSKLGISPLMLAAMNGHTAAVKLLLDMGSDINAQIETNRNTALTLACFQGRHEVVSLLVDRKANIEHRAKTGLTPLMEAASGGYTEVGRVLLDKGADVNAPPVPSSRDTALTIAADKGHYRFVELLLSRNAAVDVKNKKGNSPLWLSCNGGHLDVVQLLVTSGADIDSQDNRKVSCLMSAFRKGHIKVVKWMVKHVSQFPSDTECTRYIATINDKELLKKCHQCMETIRMAKERQEAEANKNASILLEELDMEKSREESKKAAAARRRERKRLKRKEKQSVGCKDDDDEYEETENEINKCKNNKNKIIENCSIIKDSITEKIKTPKLPPDVTLTPINPGDNLIPKREEKNTVSIMKIESNVNSSEPMVTNMGTVIVVETKPSIVPQVDPMKSNSKSQSMITISRINSNTVTVSSHNRGDTDKNLVCISQSPLPTSSMNKKQVRKENEPSAVIMSTKIADKSSRSKEAIKKQQVKEKQSNKENKPSSTKDKSVAKNQLPVVVSCADCTNTTTTVTSTCSKVSSNSSSRMAAAATMTTTVVSSGKINKTNGKKKNNRDSSSSEKEDKNVKKKDTKDMSNQSIKDSDNDNAQGKDADADNLVIEPLSTTGIGDLDDFGSLPENKKAKSHHKAKGASGGNIRLDTYNDLPLDVHDFENIPETQPLRSPNSALVMSSLRSTIGHSPNSTSPKKGHKKEDGWKEVVRRSKKVSVPSNAISRVIGRGGSNINAIREVSGAHIEVEKQRNAGDRTIIIRGSAEATRQAHQLITALIKDPDRELLEILPKSNVLSMASKADKTANILSVTSPLTKLTKSATLPSSNLSVYSTPPFPATAIKQPARPGIPTTSLGCIGAAFPINQMPQSWPSFNTPIQSSLGNCSQKSSIVTLDAGLSKSPASRQLFSDNSAMKTLANQSLVSTTKSTVSYTMATIASGKNTKTVTTTNSTSMSTRDYKSNQPPRLSNKSNGNSTVTSSAFDNMTQFKAPSAHHHNGLLRMSTVPSNGSNTSSSSSGSPIAQEYSPFNSIFSKVAQQSVWGGSSKGMNFASVAASGVTSLATTIPTISQLHQTSISSPSTNDNQTEPIDAAKAPGYRGNGSHVSPGSNSTGSGHYSAPNTPPIHPIGTPSAHTPGCVAGQPSPAIPSPPLRPSSLPESRSSDEISSNSMVSPAAIVGSVPSRMVMQMNNIDKFGSNAGVVASSYLSNAPPPVVGSHSGILSVANLAPGGPVTSHGSGGNMVNTIGVQQSRVPPLHPGPMPVLPNQPMYPNSFMPPASLHNVIFAQNSINNNMASSPNINYATGNIIQSNLNPNAPDFSSRTNIGSGMIGGGPQTRLQQQQPGNYMANSIGHQSAFRPPVMQNQHSFPQQSVTPPAGFPVPQTAGINRLPFLHPSSGMPIDLMAGLTAEAAATAVHLMAGNRNQTMNNAESSYSQLQSGGTTQRDSNTDDQHKLLSTTGMGSNSSGISPSSSNNAVGDDRKSLPRPIGNERAHRKTPVFGGVSDVKGIWSFSNSDPSTADWMSATMNHTAHQLPLMSGSQDDIRLPPPHHMLPNGNAAGMASYHTAMAAAARMNGGGDGSLQPMPVDNNQVDHSFQPTVGMNPTTTNNYNSMTGPASSSFLKNMTPNMMAVMMNPHLYNAANNVVGSANDYWMPSSKLPTSNVDHHVSTSKPDQKPTWNASEWSSQSQV